ncbi:uncharacterized protein [Panulirus ornatus]|uniref:uncharacterized protein isoform X2 n=1 Tax=Panulirus ornatus TaxID=150431 RepID=UPI003A83CA2C
MTEKGVTIERSPSGLGMGVFSPHLGGGGGPAWEQQQNAIITKLAPTPSSRLNLNTDNFEKERRNRKSDDKVDEKNNANRSCGCGGWARAAQLEHDLAELKLTHQNLLAGLHLQVDTLKQKNRDLTFQLLMGPYAAHVKPDFPFSPESDEATSPKNELPKKIENKQKSESKSFKSTSTTTSSTNTTTTTLTNDTSKDLFKLQSPPEGFPNGDIVIRRPLPGRSGRGDPRLVRSLDLELLEEEAYQTRRMLDEERAKNKYLTTLVEDLKKMLADETPPLTPTGRDNQVMQQEVSPRPQPVDRLLGASSPVQRRAADEAKTQPDREPRFPPLRQQFHAQRGGRTSSRTGGSPTSGRLTDRSIDREGGTTFPAIPTARAEQHEQQQQRGRGRHFGRGRTRNRQQPQHEKAQGKDTPETQAIGQEQGRAASTSARGLGRPPPTREDSRGRHDVPRTPTSPRDTSIGSRAGRSGRDGSVATVSSAQSESKRGLVGHEQEPRPETRAKGRGRAHRRGGRGRPRKEKHSAPSEPPESEQ